MVELIYTIHRTIAVLVALFLMITLFVHCQRDTTAKRKAMPNAQFQTRNRFYMRKAAATRVKRRARWQRKQRKEAEEAERAATEKTEKTEPAADTQ